MDGKETLPPAHTEDAPERRLHTVDQFTQRNPAFSIGGLRWLLFNRKENGLEKAVVRVNRRVLIDEKLFFDWLDERNGPARLKS